MLKYFVCILVSFSLFAEEEQYFSEELEEYELSEENSCPWSLYGGL